MHIRGGDRTIEYDATYTNNTIIQGTRVIGY